MAMVEAFRELDQTAHAAKDMAICNKMARRQVKDGHEVVAGLRNLNNQAQTESPRQCKLRTT